MVILQNMIFFLGGGGCSLPSRMADIFSRRGGQMTLHALPLSGGGGSKLLGRIPISLRLRGSVHS